MTYFKNVSNLKELRKQYMELLKKNHPDNGGSEEICKMINAEYDSLFERLKNAPGAAASEESESEKVNPFDKEMDAAIRDAIQKIINLSGIVIEICGSWVWVSGNTFPVKDILKDSGYFWSSSKKKWYFFTGEHKAGKRRGHNMNYIYQKFGREEVASNPAPALC